MEVKSSVKRKGNNSKFKSCDSELQVGLFCLVFLIAENCSGYCTCSHCLEQPGCGWCTDPSNTGKGKCIEGSYKGPVKMPSQASAGNVYPQPLLNSSMCLEDSRYNWSFIHCPGKMPVYPSSNLVHKLDAQIPWLTCFLDCV